VNRFSLGLSVQTCNDTPIDPCESFKKDFSPLSSLRGAEIFEFEGLLKAILGGAHNEREYNVFLCALMYAHAGMRH
jgi:hypothetical protein